MRKNAHLEPSGIPIDAVYTVYAERRGRVGAPRPTLLRAWQVMMDQGNVGFSSRLRSRPSPFSRTPIIPLASPSVPKYLMTR